MAQIRASTPRKIIPLPRTRRLSWTSVALEYCHQLVLALWCGALVAASSLAIPALLEGIPDPVEASRASLRLLARLDVLGCGAGSFLLLTTFLMYFLAMRGARASLLQAGLILGMTLLSVASQLAIAPALTGILRDQPEIFTDPLALKAAGFRRLFQVNLAIVLTQGLLGATLILLGVRRWYRYGPIARDGAREASTQS